MRFIFPFAIYGIKKLKIAGQLLVVARHTDTSPSSCYEPELIPDPIPLQSGDASRKSMWR